MPGCYRTWLSSQLVAFDQSRSARHSYHQVTPILLLLLLLGFAGGCDSAGPEGISGQDDKTDPIFSIELAEGEELSFEQSLHGSTESAQIAESTYMKRVLLRTEDSGPGFGMNLPFREGKYRLGTRYAAGTEATAEDRLRLRTDSDVEFRSDPRHRHAIPEGEYVEPWVQIDEITSAQISGRLGGTLIRENGDTYEHVTITDGYFVVTEVEDDHPDIEDASAESATWPYDDHGPVEISMLHGDYQDSHPGRSLSDSLVVQVTDAQGNPIAGRMVEFSSPQGGMVPSGEMETNIDGIAWATWVLGPFHGRHTIVAVTDGMTGSGVEFGAWAEPVPPTYTGPTPDGAHGRVDAATTLTWETDNPTSDELIYDLFLSSAADSDLELVAEGLEVAKYDVELATNAKFFWSVATRVAGSDDFYTSGDTTSLTTGGWSGNRAIPMETIAAGSYPVGETGYSHTLYYDYQINTLEITNGVYAMWLNDLMATNEIEVVGREVIGFVETENPFAPDGEYVLLDMTEGGSHIHWNEPNQTFAIDYGYGGHPVTYVTWYGAKAFAQSKGLHLPTTHEWEKAARGPWRENAPLYPWGDTGPTCAFVNFDFCYSDTRPVGSFNGDESYYKLKDMAGNVWEWTETNGSSSNQASFAPIIRGGGLRSDAESVQVWTEPTAIPSHRGPDVGFRVVDVVERKYMP